MNKYTELAWKYLHKYEIFLCGRDICTCWSRPHAHGSLFVEPSKRKICKLDIPQRRSTLFDLFHEIGHIVHPQGGYKGDGDKNYAKTRALAEFNATQWAVETFRAEGLAVPRKQTREYNRYIRNKIARGLRRGL